MYSLLLYFSGFFVSPLTFLQLLPFILLPVAALYAYKFGQIVRSRRTGEILAVGLIILILVSPSSLSVIPGLARSFVVPLVIALIYYMRQQQFLQMTIIVILSALIYPPLFVLLAITWGLYTLNSIWKTQSEIKSLKRSLIYLILAIFLSIFVLSPLLVERFAKVWSAQEVGVHEKSQENEKQVLGDTLTDNLQNFIPGGRYELFTLSPIIGNGGIVDNRVDALNFTILLIMSSVILLIRGRRAFNLPYEIWSVFIASLILFLAAWMAAAITNSFIIYLPSRYSRVGLFIFFWGFISFNIEASFRIGVEKLFKKRTILAGLLLGIEVIILLILIFHPSDRTTINGFNLKWLISFGGIILAISGLIVIKKPILSDKEAREIPDPRGNRAIKGLVLFVSFSSLLILLYFLSIYARLVSETSFLNPTLQERELISYIETLPKDTLIAGSPCSLDNIPLFAKRQILFSCELDSDNAELILRALHAYYSDDISQVIELCKMYEIDYLVIEPGVYTDEYLSKGWIYFEPFNQQMETTLLSRNNFVMENIPESNETFQNEKYFVVPCNTITLK